MRSVKDETVSKLQKAIPDIIKQMLVNQLRELEDDEIINTAQGRVPHRRIRKFDYSHHYGHAGRGVEGHEDAADLADYPGTALSPYKKIPATKL